MYIIIYIIYDKMSFYLNFRLEARRFVAAAMTSRALIEEEEDLEMTEFPFVKSDDSKLDRSCGFFVM